MVSARVEEYRWGCESYVGKSKYSIPGEEGIKRICSVGAHLIKFVTI